MAERRMFAKTIVLSDAFLDMPMSARCLYFTLGMLADDDGFVNSPKSIMRQCGATEDDFKVLLAKKFILAFESGVIVIKHWRINNYLRGDRYKETKYIDEKSELSEENGTYHRGIPSGIPGGIPRIGKESIGKERLGKDSIGEVREDDVFTPPTVEEVRAYCQERGNSISAERFVSYYSLNGWMVGRSPMTDWKQAIRNWEGNGIKDKQEAQPQMQAHPEWDYAELQRRAEERGLQR